MQYNYQHQTCRQMQTCRRICFQIYKECQWWLTSNRWSSCFFLYFYFYTFTLNLCCSSLRNYARSHMVSQIMNDSFLHSPWGKYLIYFSQASYLLDALTLKCSLSDRQIRRKWTLFETCLIICFNPFTQRSQHFQTKWAEETTPA